MRRGSRVILVYLVWALARAASAATPAAPALRPLFLHLDEGALADRPAPAEALVQLGEDEFLELVKRWDEASRARHAALEALAPKPPPPAAPPRLPAALTKVELTGAVTGGTLALSGRFAYGAGCGPKAPVELMPAGWVPIGFHADSDADRLEYIDPGSGVFYRPAHDGAGVVSADVALAVQADRSRRAAVIALPGAPDQTLTVRIEGPVSGVALTPSWIPVTLKSDKDGSVRVTAPLGHLASATLSWMAHGGGAAKVTQPPAPVRPAPPVGARLFVNVATLHSIGDGIVRFHAWIDLVNSRDRVGAVSLSLPLKVSVRQVTGALVKSFEVSPQGDRKEVRVVFAEGFRGRTRVELDGEAAIPRDGEAQLPLVGVPGAARLLGVSGVSVLATYRVDAAVDRSKDVAAIDVSELPAEVSAASPSPVLLAFRSSSTHADLCVNLKRFDPHPTLFTAIEGVNAVTVMSPATVKKGDARVDLLRTYTRLVMKVANSGQQDLRFTLPADAHIESCFVDLVPQVPAKVTAKKEDRADRVTYLIPLKLSSVMENRLVPFPVEVAYRQDLARRAAFFEKVALPFPMLSAPVTNADWTVYTPDGQHVVDATGSFQNVAPDADLLLVGYGQTIFEVVIYGGGRCLCLLAMLCAIPLGLLALARRMRGAAATAAETPRAGPPVSAVFSMGIAGLIVMLMASIATPNFKAARERANTRACYANQKTVVGAMEMYNLDKNTKRTTLDASFFQNLKSGGYLQSVPQDPGQGPGTSGHYHACPTGNGISCTEHGSIQ